MRVLAQSFWLPKRGNAPEEYEDAFAPERAHLDTDDFRCAVADGATEASFSGQWARALADAWEDGRLGFETFVEDVAALQEDWALDFASQGQGRGLSWYAEQKASYGAFSSLVGLVLRPAAELSEVFWWDALAVGDSNLIQVRDGELVAAFPLTRAAEFDCGPFLISSNAGTAGNDLARHVAVAQGELQGGDSLYLMSDALACWFLGACERGERPWELLDALPMERGRSAPFAALVGGLRDRGELHNDDVTLLRVVLETAAVQDAVPAGAGAVGGADAPAAPAEPLPEDAAPALQVEGGAPDAGWDSDEAIDEAGTAFDEEEDLGGAADADAGGDAEAEGDDGIEAGADADAAADAAADEAAQEMADEIAGEIAGEIADLIADEIGEETRGEAAAGEADAEAPQTDEQAGEPATGEPPPAGQQPPPAPPAERRVISKDKSWLPR